MTTSLELTEDRTVKDSNLPPYLIAQDILRYAGSEMLEKVLLAPEGVAEHYFDYHWSSVTPSRDFYATVEKLQRSSLTKINTSAIRMWREKGKGITDPRRKQPTKLQSAMLEKAIVFCESSGFMLRDEYPIFIVETLGESGTLAIADKVGKQIFLTEMLFNQDGTKGVARTLIEEYLHLKFGYDDCSREMQNFLFAKVVSLAEELKGEPL